MLVFGGIISSIAADGKSTQLDERLERAYE
jgi:hypothetical protein